MTVYFGHKPSWFRFGNTPNVSYYAGLFILITTSSTIEFGLRGQPSGFYEESGTKKAPGLVKEGGMAK